MMEKSKGAGILILLCLAVGDLFVQAGLEKELWTVPEKKLIGFGWDSPTPDYLRKNIRAMEENSPFDGIGINYRVTVMVDNQPFVCETLSVSNPKVAWKYEWFKDVIADLKATEFRQFKHNFLASNIYKRADWFNDREWAVVNGNFALLARIAKETGLKGLRFDTEHYPYGGKQFKYDPKSGKSFEETYRMARQRGREFITAIGKEYPDVTFFSYFWLTLLNWEEGMASLPSAEYGLKVGFINGIYDGILPAMTIVEGSEEDGYRAASDYDYYKLYYRAKMGFDALVAPENRAKAKAQTQISVATYLDAYLVVDNGDTWHIRSDEPDKVKLLGKNLAMALKFSDEYAWVWGEKGKWWPIPIIDWRKDHMLKQGDSLWDKAFPGVLAAMRGAKDPVKAIRAEIQKGKLKNILKNANFQGNSKSGAPTALPDVKVSATPGWYMYLDKESLGGTFVTLTGNGIGKDDNSCVRAENVKKSGSLLQSVPVKPGEEYYLEGYIRTEGESVGKIAAYWLTPESQWNWSLKGYVLTPKTGEAWHYCSTFIKVPKGAGFMSIQLGADNQKSVNDKAYFDNLGLYLIKKSENPK